jgi:hypothetical protein
MHVNMQHSHGRTDSRRLLPRFGRQSKTPVSGGREAVHCQNECATKDMTLYQSPDGLDRMSRSRFSFVESQVRERDRLQHVQTTLGCPFYSLAMSRIPVGLERPRLSGLCGMPAGDWNNRASRYRPISSYPTNAAKRERGWIGGIECV